MVPETHDLLLHHIQAAVDSADCFSLQAPTDASTGQIWFICLGMPHAKPSFSKAFHRENIENVITEHRSPWSSPKRTAGDQDQYLSLVRD